MALLNYLKSTNHAPSGVHPSLGGALLNVLFPPVCQLCEGDILTGPFCNGCSGTFTEHLLKGPLCTLCGEPFATNSGPDHQCGDCITGRMPFALARSAYTYKSTVLRAIHKFKYNGKTALAHPLGRLLADSATELPVTPDIIVPVPLHKKRLRSRGFNQSLLLAREVSRHTDTALDYLNLQRGIYTTPQITLKANARKLNVSGAFRLENSGAFKGKKVLLIDDVFTTGATIRECSKVLKKAGAEVFALTLARASRISIPNPDQRRL